MRFSLALVGFGFAAALSQAVPHPRHIGVVKRAHPSNRQIIPNASLPSLVHQPPSHTTSTVREERARHRVSLFVHSFRQQPLARVRIIFSRRALTTLLASSAQCARTTPSTTERLTYSSTTGRTAKHSHLPPYLRLTSAVHPSLPTASPYHIRVMPA